MKKLNLVLFLSMIVSFVVNILLLIDNKDLKENLEEKDEIIVTAIDQTSRAIKLAQYYKKKTETK